MGLEEEFTTELWNTIEIARENNYNPSYFMQMLQQYKGVDTAKRLLAKHEVQAGLSTLWELGLLNISMEAVVIQEKYRSLFTTEEIAEAYRRLEELGYFK